MRSLFRRSLLSAAAVGGLVLSGSALAAAADAPHPAHSAPRQTGLTLRPLGNPSEVATATVSTPLIALGGWSGDPQHQAKLQTWTLAALGGGRYTIRNASGMCMKWDGPEKDSTPVLQAKCSNSDHQLRWHLVQRGAGYQVQTDAGRCLNVQGGAYPGHGLIIYTCVPGGAPNDVWLPTWQQG